MHFVSRNDTTITFNILSETIACTNKECPIVKSHPISHISLLKYLALEALFLNA